MAAIIDIQTGSRLSRTSASHVSATPGSATLRVIHGGRSPEGIRMRRVYIFRRCLVAAVALLLVVAGALVVKAVVGGLGSGVGADSGALVDGSGTYLVQSGDTLWAVANEVAPDRDPRDVIDRIVDANGVNGAPFDVNVPLLPGQELIIPDVS